MTSKTNISNNHSAALQDQAIPSMFVCLFVFFWGGGRGWGGVLLNPEDEVNKILPKAVNYLLTHMAQHPRRLRFSVTI